MSISAKVREYFTGLNKLDLLKTKTAFVSMIGSAGFASAARQLSLSPPVVDAQCCVLDRIVNVVEQGTEVAVRIGERPDSSLQAARISRVLENFEPARAPLPAHGVPHEDRHAPQRVRGWFDLALEMRTGVVAHETGRPCNFVTNAVKTVAVHARLR